MAFDSYFNKFGGTVNSVSGDDFTGIWGLGERVNEFYLKNGTYTIWDFEQVNPIEDGKAPGKNIYGSQPFYMSKVALKDNKAGYIGVFS